MLIVLAVATLAILWWSYALARRRPWIRWIGIGCCITTAATTTISLASLERTANEVAMSEASNKATQLAQGISVAMNAVAVGVLCAVVAIVALLIFTLRKPAAA